MGQSEHTKIRILPRQGEKAQASKSRANAAQPTKPTPANLFLYGAVGLIILASASFLTLKLHPKANRKLAKAAPSSWSSAQGEPSTDEKITESVTRHMQDSEIKHEMMRRTREIENLQFKDALNEPNDDQIASLPDNSNYGVQMDSDDSADRIYEDLNGEPVKYSETLPGDRINARLATRKWLNEQEREERMTYVSNFIKSAYDRGYEVEIDQNLVVVGFKKINTTKKLNINQVMDRLAKQGL